jgi:hypothetical protein
VALFGERDVRTRLLFERLRNGGVSGEMVALAAYCGDAAAASLLHSEEPPPTDEMTWACGLWRWGPAICVRAFVAATWPDLSRIEAANPKDTDSRRCLEVVEEWLLCPCAEHVALLAPPGTKHWHSWRDCAH